MKNYTQFFFLYFFQRKNRLSRSLNQSIGEALDLFSSFDDVCSAKKAIYSPTFLSAENPRKDFTFSEELSKSKKYLFIVRITERRFSQANENLFE